MSQNQTKKRFEIEIYDQVSVGEPPYDKIQLQKVNYSQPVVIEAAGKADLDAFAEKLKLCSQTFKIVRVLDDVPQAPSTGEAKPKQLPPAAPVQTNQTCEQLPPQAVQTRKPPRFYRVGNVDLKEVDGKIYQREWTNLSGEEAKLVRLISDKTGQPVKLHEKSFQILRWTPVGSLEEQAGQLEDLDFETQPEEDL